jgi:hypothetical protein
MGREDLRREDEKMILKCLYKKYVMKKGTGCRLST